MGGVIETVSWRDTADAILLAWQPGQEAGHAIADVLTGRTAPSGTLATTFPVGWQDLPSSVNFPGKTLPKPELELRAFAKTNLLRPGESQRLSFTLVPRALSSRMTGTRDSGTNPASPQEGVRQPW